MNDDLKKPEPDDAPAPEQERPPADADPNADPAPTETEKNGETPVPTAAPPSAPAAEPEKTVPPAPGPIRVVGVKFRRAGKTYFFNAGQLIFNIGEQVIVETDRGLGLCRVMTPVIELDSSQLPPELKRVIRKANWNDLERDRKNRLREREALKFCQERISERRLPMRLAKVEYLHDASKAIFYFTAEHRVDFRDLVKDLARELHTRIEMRQIGVRDETKLIGGLGPCGREACCASFLADFAPVSVRMAKDQNLAMNPGKVSGLCGRLMCCLGYEHESYQELKRTMPKKGKRMVSPLGPCRVVDMNILTQKVFVELESGKTMFVPVAELLTPAEAEKLDREMAEEETEELETPAELLESDDPGALEEMEKIKRKKAGARNGPPAPSKARPASRESAPPAGSTPYPGPPPSRPPRDKDHRDGPRNAGQRPPMKPRTQEPGPPSAPADGEARAKPGAPPSPNPGSSHKKRKKRRRGRR